MGAASKRKVRSGRRSSGGDDAEAKLLYLLRRVDAHVHLVAARRVAAGKPAGLSLSAWESMYDRLLRFVGSTSARKIREAIRE